MLAKVIVFPNERRAISRSCCSNKDALADDPLRVILELVWNDAEAYRSLKERCLSENSWMDQQTKKKLKELRLIDRKGQPKKEVASIMRSIIKESMQNG